MTSTLPETDPASLPRRHATLVGVLAVTAAIGVGHLMAGVVSPTSSPYLAVADAVVRLAPDRLVEFATSTFGTADKAVLLGGMAVVVGLVAAAAGITARRDPQPGVVVLGALGLVVFLAVTTSPTFAALDLVAPTGAVATAIVVFRRLHALAAASASTRFTRESADAPADRSRRRLLVGSSVAVGVGTLAAGWAGQLLTGGARAGSRDSVTSALARARVARPTPPLPPGADFAADGTPTFVTPNAAFYRIDTALRVPNLAVQDWSLRVHGMVERELRLTFDDVLARPLVQRPVTLVCVSNEVGDEYISTAVFTGVDLRELLLEAGVRPGADQLLSTSTDGWTAGTPTDVLLEPDRGALLAIGMNGEALPAEHGFPARLVVPGLYGFVSATKWVTDLELTTFAARTGYWQPRGWARLSPVKTQSRIDSPRRFRRVPAGRVPVAGIAWSQPDGISRVEVRLVGGAWQDAELATEVSGDTWRMWRTSFEVAPGEHVVQVRATATRGVTQTEDVAPPVPDGATGWHSVAFSVR